MTTERKSQYEDNSEEVAAVVAALKKAGIRMQVGGCGCCGSPWVKFEVGGKVVADCEDFTFSMFEGGECGNGQDS